jgi:hypothetical protein
MLDDEHRVDDTLESKANGNPRRFRLWHQMARLRAGLMKLALEIRQGDFHIEHGHVGRAVPQQFHYGGETDARANHFRGVGVSHLMRDDARRQAKGMAGLMQVIAELTNECFFGVGTRQEQTVGGQRIQGAKKAEALD